MNAKAKSILAITIAAAAILGLVYGIPAISTRGMGSSTASSTSSTTTSTSLTEDASSTNKNFYLFNTELEGVNETKLGVSGDLYSLQTMVVNKGDKVTVHFYNVEPEEDERHSFTIGAPYNINEELAGGDNTTFSFIADHKGIFQYQCVFHQPQMRGQLVVLPSTSHKVNTNVQVEIQPQVNKIVTHITTVNPQVNQVNIQQVINQLAIQIVNIGGNGSVVVNQLANQVAVENGNGNVSQFVKQLALEQASGNTQSVNQTITQLAKQVANGNENNVIQIINQKSIQETNTTSLPSLSTNQTSSQSANQTTTATPSLNASNQTTSNQTTTNSTSSSNPLSDLAKLFGFK